MIRSQQELWVIKETLFLSVFLLLEIATEPCLKDLSEETIEELSIRLQSDEVSCKQFYHSFGLENRHPENVFREIGNIGKLFPDTPIKLVIDVCRELQLYDLVELLEKAAKPKTLRPALPLKEIAKLLSCSNRPITFYSKVKIVFVGYTKDAFDTIGNFFKKICPGSKTSGLEIEFDFSRLQNERRYLAEERDFLLPHIEELQHFEESRFYGPAITYGDRETELEKRKDEIDKKLLQINEELQEKKAKIEADISSAFNKSWGEERGKNLCILRPVI